MAPLAHPWFRTNRQCWYVHHKGRMISLGKDKDTAFKKFHRLKSGDASVSSVRQVDSALSVADVFDRFLDWCQSNRSARTYEWAQYLVQLFCDHLKTAGQMPAMSLRPFHVTEWIASQADWADNTKNGGVRAIQRCYSWAHQSGHIETNPIAKVAKPTPVRREEYITREAYEELIANYPPNDPFRDLLVFLWETGCRPGEARVLTWQHYEEANQRFVIPAVASKGKKRPRVIRLSAAAVELVTRRADLGHEYVFTNRVGDAWLKSTIGARFFRLKQRTGSKLFAYALRHGFATRKLVEGHNPLTVAELMGHKDGTMLAKVYSHLDAEDKHLRDALK